MVKNGRSYVELDAWKEARILVSSIYSIPKTFPDEEKWALTSQIKRAAISVPSNIAEGVGRQHNKERIQFLYISRGSLYEIETQLFIAFDQDYINEEQLNVVLDQITTCKKLLHGYINFLKKEL